MIQREGKKEKEEEGGERERERDHNDVICRVIIHRILVFKTSDIMLTDLVSIDFLGLPQLHNKNSRTIFRRLLTV